MILTGPFQVGIYPLVLVYPLYISSGLYPLWCGISGHGMVYQSTGWYIVEWRGISWNGVVYQSMGWYIVEWCGISGHGVVYQSTGWYSAE